MRNNSVVVTIAVVLLSACSMLCPAEGFFYYGLKQQDAFKLLNVYLARHEKSADLAKNIEAAKSYLSEPDANSDVKSLVELFLQIDPEDLCGAENISRKRKFIKALESKQPELFRKRTSMTRLGTLVHNCIQLASDTCFDSFEQQWAGNWTKIRADLMELNESTFVMNIDQFNLLGAPERSNRARDEALMLESSLNTYFMETAGLVDSAGAEQDFELSPDEPISDDQKLHGFSDDIDEEREQIGAKTSADFTLKDVKYRIEQTIFDPCRKLLEHEQSRSILEPVGQLGSLVDLTRLPIQSIGSQTVSTFLWASRYYHCKWIVLRGETRLAEDFLERNK